MLALFSNSVSVNSMELRKVHPLLILLATLFRKCVFKQFWKSALCDVTKWTDALVHNAKN